MFTFIREKSSRRGLTAGLAVLAVTAGVLTASPAVAATSKQSPANSTGNPATAPAGAAKLSANAPKLPDGHGPTPAEQRAMETAAALARKSGKQVVVDALTTPTVQVVALPGGGFQMADNPSPVRAQTHSVWAPIDATLRKNPDGTFSPANIAYAKVTFGAAGSHILATTATPDGGSYQLSWLTALPAPSAAGSTLTYRGVLPGVDLLIAANASGGFSETLVVRDAKAAANPALAKLVLPVRATGHADARSRTLATSPAGMALSAAGALMWDSSTGPGRQAHADPSTAHAPGQAARTAVIGMSATGQALTLTPDLQLLHGPGTIFPLYIDPSYTWHNSGTLGTQYFDEVKQYGPCAGQAETNNSGSGGDYGQLGVGYASSGNPNYSTCSGDQRTFYQWKLPSYINQAYIKTATVGVTEVWQASFSCSYSHTINLHWSGGIGTGTNWSNQPGYMTGADSFNASTSIGSAYNPNGCQNPTSSTAGFNVQGPVQISASGNASQITFALTNDSDETHYNGTGFARYADNPTLQIQYGHTPTTPAASQLTASTSGSNTVPCTTAAPYPFVGTTIASNGITLTGANLTSPDADPLQANFKYWLTLTPGTTYTASSAFGITNGQSASIKLPSSFTNTLTNGTNVSWQMQTTNLQWPSGWSPVCTFTAEPTAPAPPIIAANTTYPAGVTGATADTAATFQITGDPTGATAAKFYYNLDQGTTTNGTPVGQIAMPVGTTASSPAHRWLLSGAGSDSVGSSTVTLAAGADWGTDANRQNVMNSTSATNSYASAGGPLLNTTASYSVSAWVKLTSTSGDAVAVSQAGTNIGAFFLGYDANKTGWCFYGYNGDVRSSGLTNWPGVCPTTDHPTLGLWTLLTGVYDASAKTRALYVNGTLIGTGPDTTAFATSGALTIGDERYNATAAFNFPGQISDVQTYSRALTGTDVSAMYNTNNTNVTITPPSPGPHTLNVEAVDAAGDVSSTASYSFIAKTHTGASCQTLAQCFDNTAISSDSAPSQANADGAGNSLSVTDLGNAGWSSNGHVTIDGADLTLPTFGSGQADNVIAQNQVINYSYPVPTTGASSLMFLTTATNGGYVDPGQITGDDTAPFIGAGTGVAGERCFTGTTDNGYCTPNGVITYAAGCAAATNNNQSYDLTVPDWTAGPSSPAAVALPHLNNPNGQKAKTAYLYPFAIPLYPGCTVQSITLPDNSTINGSTSAIHLFALGTRNTTTGTVESDGTTHATDSGKTWTGAWAEDTEGNYDFETGSFSDQSFRVLVQPSVTGNVVRVKLDNALGTSTLHIGHATVALAAGNDINASAATASGSTPVNLTFANSPSTVIPEGGMVFSDPLSFNVTSGQWLDVSFYLSSTATNLVQHSWATDAYEYAAPVGSGDHTADSAATAYTASGNVNGTFTDLVTGLDVETAGMPTQVVLGDNLIDAWQNNTAPLSPNQGAALRLTDDLANATPTTPAPWGTVNAGIESNQITVDNPETLTNVGAVGGPSASSRIDRDVLDEPGINTVIVNQGLEDALSAPNILNGNLTLDQVTSNLEGAMTGLVGELAATPTTSSGTGFINTVALGLTPCGGYNGSGSTGTGTNANDPCNANVETVRTALNGNLSSGTGLGLSPYGSGSASFFYVDPDPVIGVTADNPVQLVPAAQVGTSRNNSPADPVNLTNAGIGALTNAILANQDVWQLTDGTGGNPADQATDSAPTHYSNAYLTGTDVGSGKNTLTLNGTEGTNYTWPAAAVGANANTTVLGLDGATGYADSGGVPVINTTGSFTISAWANLTSLPTWNAAIASQSGTSDSAFYFGYNYFHANKPTWDFYFATTDTTNPSFADAASSTAATGWTHLVGVYNATTKSAQLYVNGTLAATATGVTTWNATGAFTLGRDLYNGSPTDYFPGQISDVQAFNYALTAPQITALYDQIQ